MKNYLEKLHSINALNNLLDMELLLTVALYRRFKISKLSEIDFSQTITSKINYNFNDAKKRRSDCACYPLAGANPRSIFILMLLFTPRATPISQL